MKSNEQIVEKFLKLFHDAQFDEAGKLLSQDCVVYWPNTRETFTGKNFIVVNKRYPGRWFNELVRLLSKDDVVVSVTRVYSEHEKQSFYATSFFKFKGERVCEITEYWGAISEPPAWRIKEGLSERH